MYVLRMRITFYPPPIPPATLSHFLGTTLFNSSTTLNSEDHQQGKRVRKDAENKVKNRKMRLME